MNRWVFFRSFYISTRNYKKKQNKSSISSHNNYKCSFSLISSCLKKRRRRRRRSTKISISHGKVPRTQNRYKYEHQ